MMQIELIGPTNRIIKVICMIKRNQGWLLSLEPEQLDGWDDVITKVWKTCDEMNMEAGRKIKSHILFSPVEDVC